MKSIYKQMKKAKVPINNHASDLYVPVNGTTQTIVSLYKYRQNVQVFKSQIDKKMWFDIPFAFDPWWDNAEKTIDYWCNNIKKGENT